LREAEEKKRVARILAKNDQKVVEGGEKSARNNRPAFFG
jgi:hypothetical protein